MPPFYAASRLPFPPLFAGGRWHQEYTGELVDPSFSSSVADWIKWLAARVRAAGMSLTLNLYPATMTK